MKADNGDDHGRLRVVISGVQPEIDGGRWPIKRTVGESVVVEADIFAEGHDAIAAVLLYRDCQQTEWAEAPMQPLVNDRWRGEFRIAELRPHAYTLIAWVDRFQSWFRTFSRKSEAGQDVSSDILVGIGLIEETAKRASGADIDRLRAWVEVLRLTGHSEFSADLQLRMIRELSALIARYPDRRFVTRYEKELAVSVDRERARFSTWYELFPRSCASKPGEHGTFRDCVARLPYIAEMGFDVLYLPPIHPVGVAHRKGPNNATKAAPGDPGSPWAIGGEGGGHKAIHPELGTLADFRALAEACTKHGIEIALDIAFQCSPDHPYLKDHSEWFRRRPDGTLQYAENPPKKYQDIYPFDFETDAWRALWEELKSIFDYWIEQGVRIFRVDNPHTKPFVFWQWVIGEIRAQHPDVLFLSEAFTRPKVMYRLAKVGFTQSYTYFAWRNRKHEIIEYFTELTRTSVGEFFRPNAWPNTPDILTEFLQTGGRPGFMIRAVLAGTLTANYGIYGPAFELCEGRPRESGSEEYLNSEKYEIRHWDLQSSDSLKDFIARINHIRHENPALQSDRSLQFHGTDNDSVLAFSKMSDDGSNTILTVVNLDPHYVQGGWVDVNMPALGMEWDQAYQVHDLLGDSRYLWNGARNFVQLDPHQSPAHIFRIRRHVRREQDFDYFA